jgi:hypothetical protein
MSSKPVVLEAMDAAKQVAALIIAFPQSVLVHSLPSLSGSLHEVKTSQPLDAEFETNMIIHVGLVYPLMYFVPSLRPHCVPTWSSAFQPAGMITLDACASKMRLLKRSKKVICAAQKVQDMECRSISIVVFGVVTF